MITTDSLSLSISIFFVMYMVSDLLMYGICVRWNENLWVSAKNIEKQAKKFHS